MREPIIIAAFPKNRRETFRVALDQWQGVDLVDLRVTVDLTGTSGVQSPTKRGVSLNVALLPQLVAALQEAEARARELGLIGGDA